MVLPVCPGPCSARACSDKHPPIRTVCRSWTLSPPGSPPTGLAKKEISTPPGASLSEKIAETEGAGEDPGADGPPEHHGTLASCFPHGCGLPGAPGRMAVLHWYGLRSAFPTPIVARSLSTFRFFRAIFSAASRVVSSRPGFASPIGRVSKRSRGKRALPEAPAEPHEIAARFPAKSKRTWDPGCTYLRISE
ncbi:MAG: hypothetical protein METHP_01870 [Methanoregula sp. SKADARSKE-2]|nr:MAG: hypothetical protein METHP_01870 [Methanoregula sp. SKADARSKE-2]